MLIYVQDLFVRVIILSKQFAEGDAEFNQLQSCSDNSTLLFEMNAKQSETFYVSLMTG